MKGSIRILPAKISATGLLTGQYRESYVTEVVDGEEHWIEGHEPGTAAKAAMRAAAARLSHLARTSTAKKKKTPAKG